MAESSTSKDVSADPRNWYWNTGSGVFSSAVQAVVPYSDAGYQAFLARGLSPLPYPGDDNMRTFLNQLGLGLTPTETTQLPRTQAKQVIDSSPDKFGKLHRAVASAAVDEINLLREWTVALKAAVAGAATLAALKTAVAALDTLNDRTLTQFKNAVDNKIDSGTVH